MGAEGGEGAFQQRMKRTKTNQTLMTPRPRRLVFYAGYPSMQKYYPSGPVRFESWSIFRLWLSKTMKHTEGSARLDLTRDGFEFIDFRPVCFQIWSFLHLSTLRSNMLGSPTGFPGLTPCSWQLYLLNHNLFGINYCSWRITLLMYVAEIINFCPITY